MPPLLTAGFRPFFLAAATWAALAMAAWLPLLAGEHGPAEPLRSAELAHPRDAVRFHHGRGRRLPADRDSRTGPTAPRSAGTPLAVLVGLWLLGRFACLLSALFPAGWWSPPTSHSPSRWRSSPRVNCSPRETGAIIRCWCRWSCWRSPICSRICSVDVAIPSGSAGVSASRVVIVLISVIGGRIVPAFTRNWLTARGNAPVPPTPDMLDRIALGTLIAGMIAWTFLPDWQPVGVLLLAAAALNLVRLARWRGVATFEEPLLLILHVGYLWLVVGRRSARAVADQRRRPGRRRGPRADRRRDGHHDPRGHDPRHARSHRPRAACRRDDGGDLCAGERCGACCASPRPGRSRGRWTARRSAAPGMGRRLRTVRRRVRSDAVGARGDDAAILRRQQR